MIAALEASGHRVLRPIEDVATGPDGEFFGAFVDVETTGLNPMTDKIVQLGVKIFRYTADGVLTLGGETAQVHLEDPGAAIPEEATAVHGLTWDFLIGQRIPETVGARLLSCRVLVAHNAAYDAPFLVRRFPVLYGRPWACSLRDIDWKRQGYDSARLKTLASEHGGAWLQAHDAGHDVAGLAHVLRTPFADGRQPFTEMLETARQPRYSICAHSAPYEVKDELKARGYRWYDANDPARWHAWKGWVREVTAADRDAETAWVNQLCGRRAAWHVAKITAADRFLPWNLRQQFLERVA